MQTNNNFNAIVITAPNWEDADKEFASTRQKAYWVGQMKMTADMPLTGCVALDTFIKNHSTDIAEGDVYKCTFTLGELKKVLYGMMSYKARLTKQNTAHELANAVISALVPEGYEHLLASKESTRSNDHKETSEAKIEAREAEEKAKAERIQARKEHAQFVKEMDAKGIYFDYAKKMWVERKPKLTAEEKRERTLLADRKSQRKHFNYLDQEHYSWSDVEGYDRVLADGCDIFSCGHKWHVHHKLENTGLTKKQLINMGLYYNRPADELQFLPMDAHMRLHHRIRKAVEKLSFSGKTIV